MPKKKDYGPPTRLSERLSQSKELSDRTPEEATPKTEESDEEVIATPTSIEPAEPAPQTFNTEPDEPVDSIEVEAVESDIYDSATENFQEDEDPEESPEIFAHRDA